MSKTDEYINGITDWRCEQLSQLRYVIASVPGLTEDFKWGVPVWTHNGLVCAISAFKDHVKINFFKGAQLEDPKRIFNSGLDSKEHRSINFDQDSTIDSAYIKQLIQAAVTLNEKE